MLQLIQELDWTILHGIRDTLQCGLLDVLMPKITMLGDGGAVWLAAFFGLILSKKYRKYGCMMLGALAAGVLAGNVCLNKTPPLLAGGGQPADPESGGLLLPFRAYPLLRDRCVYADRSKPKILSGSHPPGGTHRLFTAVSVCAFPVGCTGFPGHRHADRQADHHCCRLHVTAYPAGIKRSPSRIL